jgi:amino acid permease
MFSVLDKFLGLVGAIFCAPMAFIIPTMCHLKLVARTNEEKLKDIAIVAFSIMIMVFCVE